MLGRLGVARSGNPVRELLDTMIPVRPVGPMEFDDFSQPLWACTGQTQVGLGRFSSAALVSDFDLVVSRISLIAFDAASNVSNANITLGVPPAFYDLFEFPDLSFLPGLRPTVERFNAFTTAVTTSQNTLPMPLSAELGWTSSLIDVNTFIVLTIPIAQSTRQQTTFAVDFDPPLILPAGLFLVTQPGFVDVGIRVTYWYREMPNALQRVESP